jgi:hypothetical protein
MYTRKGMKSQKQIAWLMALGRGLRVEYDKRVQPLPPGLAALVQQFEIGEQLNTRQRKAPKEKKSSALLSLAREPSVVFDPNSAARNSRFPGL